ncbi:MAG: peptidoglycan bridge formation glycyltransferase FemA/FemB family protein [Bacteroidetes bacterium]|nr:MAG: peptidoglycan bridge formation glycyltransferase FemA/FemB family protein [Bacteroidota bacterium]
MNASTPGTDMKVFLSLSEKQEEEVASFFRKLEFRSHYNSPDWAEWVEPYKKPMYFCFYENEQMSGFSIVYVKMSFCVMRFAPVVIDTGSISKYAGQIADYLKKEKFGLLTVHLPFMEGSDMERSVLEKLKMKHKVSIEKEGWCTIQIQLAGKTPEDIFKDFSKGHKSSVKKALKEEVEVRMIRDKESLEKLASIYDEMHHRKGLILPLIDSGNVFTRVAEKELGVVAGVFKNNVLLGGVVFISEGNNFLYKFGATDVQYHHVPVLHIAIYEMIKYAIEAGFKKMDLCGYDPDAKEGSYAYGVNLFKKGFGGEIIEYVKPLSVRFNNAKFFLVSVASMAKNFLPGGVVKWIYARTYWIPRN